VSLPYARPMPSPRQRYYGKRRPVKKSTRSIRLDSSPTPPTKRAAVSSAKPKTNKMLAIEANDDSSSEEEISQVRKKPPASHAANRPVASSKSTCRSRKIVTENHDESSSSDEERTGHKNPTSSRAMSKNSRRRTLDKAPPSYPAFTPIVPKKARRNSTPRVRTPIRVNLTPDRSDMMPKGWLTKSQLLDVASRHKGMAIQYRVMYHMSHKSIKDHNAGAARKIRYKDVVVQTRFACVSGSSGGSSYSFMRWKLPGTLLQSRKAKHITIYEDTRPRLYEHGSKETSHPLIILCSELKDADRRMAERFLRDAEAGMTPEQFYSQKTFATADQNGEAGSREAEMVVEHSEEDSPLVSHDEDFNDDAVGGYEDETENQPSPAKQSSVSVRESRRDKHSKDKARPPRDQRSVSNHKSSSTKRGRDEETERSTTVKRTRKKDYGGARSRRREMVTFDIGESGSSAPQFLALVEGVAGATPAARGPEDVAEDYIRDVFMNGRVENLPSSGRMLELPGEAKPGKWSAELVDTNGGGRASRKGIMRDKLENLKDVRIQLRHDSVKAMGALELSRSSSSVASSLSHSSADIEHRIRGGGVSSRERVTGVGGGTVSLIDPSHSRSHDLLSQGVVSRESLFDHPELCVGSISIVGFDGFASSTDARLSAGSKSAVVLESCRKRAIEMEAQGSSSIVSLEDILLIPADKAADDHNLGVSFICKIAVEESYALLLAHDEVGHVVAVDGE